MQCQLMSQPIFCSKHYITDNLQKDIYECHLVKVLQYMVLYEFKTKTIMAITGKELQKHLDSRFLDVNMDDKIFEHACLIF